MNSWEATNRVILNVTMCIRMAFEMVKRWSVGQARWESIRSIKGIQLRIPKILLGKVLISRILDKIILNFLGGRSSMFKDRKITCKDTDIPD